ncbi:MAG: hypothetical protein HYX92_19730 [Chloroflexi bacterium]|nr:hypothetical protein [Chloroflexota bacterium]
MTGDVRAIFVLVHLVSTLLMAAPFYMLVIVNERGRFAVPPGHNPDRYMENIIKSQPIRCYVYLATILVTGVVIMLGSTSGLGLVLTNWALDIKIAVFLLLVSLLSYVHFGIQPQIEALLAKSDPNGLLPEALRPQLAALRTRRKKLSATCLFLVLTAVIMGLRVFNEFSPLLLIVFVILAALFAWRSFRTRTAYGWF